ncbi:putative tagatose-6-phosphate ketose/aldose isomerase [Escherichia coli]|nr:putative tagatose-6-phosphate ketose/aldose isomerase [Escherichia coli]
MVVFVSSHPYTRQYDLDLLAELRRDNQAMRVIAIAAESSDIVAAGPHIILPPSRHFIDVEQAFLLPDVRPDVCTDAVAAHGQYAGYPISQWHR